MNKINNIIMYKKSITQSYTEESQSYTEYSKAQTICTIEVMGTGF